MSSLKFIILAFLLLSSLACSRIESVQSLNNKNSNIPGTIPQTQLYSPNFTLHNLSAGGGVNEATSYSFRAKKLSIDSEGFTKGESSSFKFFGGSYVH